MASKVAAAHCACVLLQCRVVDPGICVEATSSAVERARIVGCCLISMMLELPLSRDHCRQKLARDQRTVRQEPFDQLNPLQYAENWLLCESAPVLQRHSAALCRTLAARPRWLSVLDAE